MPSMRQACWRGLAAAAAMAAAWSAAAQPPPMSAKDFAEAAAQSEQFEIVEGETAVAQSQDPRVRAFAQQMIQDHTRASQALAEAGAKSKLPPPTMGLSGDQSRLLNGLQSLRGPEFDRLYATHQVLAHSEAATVQQGYAARGGDPNLKQAAAAEAPLIQSHLQMAQQLRQAVGAR